jgi:hypothetical protein
MTSAAVASDPSFGRSIMLGAVGTTTAIVLSALPAGDMAPLEIDRLTDWWSNAGTALATITLVRAVGLMLAAWTVLLASLGLIASTTRSLIAVRLLDHVAPASMRRLIAASTLAGMVGHPSIAAATDQVEPTPVLIDLGRADENEPAPEPLTIHGDKGPVAAPADATPPPLVDVDDPRERWTVAAGDHLWHIAEETLLDRDLPSAERDIEHYWRRLIHDNRDAIGDDHDLIHPGLVLTLPG